ncbi:MAG: hypothetical protein ACC619_06650 [Paracoccaceae bacterium]
MEFEYLNKEKGKDAPRDQKPRGDFSFDGHRLSSLYRKAKSAATRLKNRYAPAFSLQKYFTGVRGCETPAAVYKETP